MEDIQSIIRYLSTSSCIGACCHAKLGDPVISRDPTTDAMFRKSQYYSLVYKAWLAVSNNSVIFTLRFFHAHLCPFTIQMFFKMGMGELKCGCPSPYKLLNTDELSCLCCCGYSKYNMTFTINLGQFKIYLCYFQLL